MAGQFTTTQDYNINSIEGWMGKFFAGPGDLDVVLYGDSSNSPDTSVDIFRQSFTLFDEIDPSWQGIAGLDFNLPSGIYWVAFEPTTFSGVMPDNVPFPLDNYAISPFGDPQDYNVANSNSFGFRINSSNAVPEPATMVLLGSGLIGGAFIRRKRS